MSAVDRRPLLPALALLVACGGGGGDDGNATSASASISVSASASASTSASAGSESEGAGSDSDGSGSAGAADEPPKFDLGVVPDGGGLPTDEGCENVDLLFVIDNSGSMADEQMNLVNSFPGFVSAMQMQLESALSYHVGVVTSDDNSANPSPCDHLGGLVTRTEGDQSSNQNCLPYASGKNYMDETDDLASKFQCAALVGVDGDGDEKPMEAMERALGPELAGPGQCNEGFIREDALLVVVVITDEEDDHEVADACVDNPQDGSAGGPGQWFDTVVGIKGGIESNVVVLALVGPPEPQACPPLNKCTSGVTGAEVAARIVQFSEMFTYGSVGQVCAPNFDTFFSDAISVIESACKNYKPPG